MNTTSKYPTANDIVASLISCQWQMCLVTFFHLPSLFLSSIPYIYLSTKITITQSLPLLDHPGHPSRDRSGLISQLWTSLLFWFTACITVSTVLYWIPYIVIHILPVFGFILSCLVFSGFWLYLGFFLRLYNMLCQIIFITSRILDLKWHALQSNNFTF